MFYTLFSILFRLQHRLLESASFCEKTLKIVGNNLDTLKHSLKMCNCLTFNLYICGYIFNKQQYGKKYFWKNFIL